MRSELLTLLEAITDPWHSVQFFLPLLQRDLGPWSPWGYFVRRRSRSDALILDEINARRAISGQVSPTSQTLCDVLSVLLAAEASEPGPPTLLMRPQGCDRSPPQPLNPAHHPRPIQRVIGPGTAKTGQAEPGKTRTGDGFRK